MKTRFKFGSSGATTRLQPPNYPDLVWVKCKEFKCLAYLDATGKWINFYTGKPLMDFVEVIG